jgi:hypothetical protein
MSSSLALFFLPSVHLRFHSSSSSYSFDLD